MNDIPKIVGDYNCDAIYKDEYGYNYHCILLKDHIPTHHWVRSCDDYKEFRKKTVTTKYSFYTGDLKKRLGVPEEAKLSHFKFLGNNGIDEGYWELYLDEEESDF